MTFKNFLATSKPKYDAEGDVVRLLVVDTELPDVATAQELRSYVAERYGRVQISDAAEAVWKAYQTSDRKSRGQ